MNDPQDQSSNNQSTGPIDEPLLEGADEGKEYLQKLEKCEAEKNEYLAGWQRAKADLSNYRKEEAQRLEGIAKYAVEDLMREMVVVLDNFDLGLAALEKAGPVEKGVYMIRSQIEDALRKRGLAKIVIQPGDTYDPSIAEAIAEGQSEYPAGTVMEQIEPGYRLHDKVLRPARVRLSKGQS